MPAVRGFASYLKCREGRVSCAIVLSSALILAVFIGRTFVDRIAPQNRIDFGPAQWIEASGEPTHAGYFRKTLYLDGPVMQGWMAISATGNYSLSVNNILVDQGAYPSVRLTGLYDIKKILLPGKNVIAVYVAPGGCPGPAQILVHGSYALNGSPPHQINSDSSWKASITPDGIVNSYSWRAPALDDRLWAQARPAQTDERLSTVQPVELDPRVLELQPTGKWIARRAGAARAVSFQTELQLAAKPRRAWLQIAATGAYDLVINGRLVARQSMPPQSTLGQSGPRMLVGDLPFAGNAQVPAVTSPDSGLPGAQTPASMTPQSVPRNNPGPPLFSPQDVNMASRAAASGRTGVMNDLYSITPGSAAPSIQPNALPNWTGLAAGAPVLMAYDISDWVRSGPNSIALGVRSIDVPALLLVEGFTESEKQPLVVFHTDERWRALPLAAGLPDRNRGQAQDVVAVWSYQDSPWGPLPQALAYSQLPPGEELRLCMEWTSVIAATIAVMMLLWFAVPALRSLAAPQAAPQLWTSDALWHLPVIPLFLLLWLLSFDVRLPSDWCYTPAAVTVGVALLVIGKLMTVLTCAGDAPMAAGEQSPRPSRISRNWKIAALAAIAIVGCAVRGSGMLVDSFGQDEAKLAQTSRGVLAVGFPFCQLGSFRAWQCTYELVPYTLALSSSLMGQTEFGYRLPSLIFGSLVIFLIGWVGWRLMDWRVGLVSALVYAFLPVTVNWAHDAFYPSQESFFALLTFWLFFEALRTRPLSRRYLNLAALCFVLTYYSWEGSGFILPTLILALLAMRWGEFDWITDRNLWRATVLVSLAVILQLSMRNILLIPDYLGIVYDLSEVSTPAPVFLLRLVFDPFYYVWHFFMADNQIILSVLALAAVFLLRKKPGLLYVVIVVFTLESWYTFFLIHYSPRYAFQATTLLVLAGVGALFGLCDIVYRAGRNVPVSARIIRAVSLGAVMAVFLMAENPFILKLYRLSSDPQNPAYFGRLGFEFKPDYRSAFEYVAQHLKPGDAVVSRQGHVFEFYAKRPPDYSANTILNSRMFYDGGGAAPRYIDKWSGVPSLRSIRELEDIRPHYSRIWLIAAKNCKPGALLPRARSPLTPASAPSTGKMDFDIQDLAYFETLGKVVEEANCEEVILLEGSPDSHGARRLAGPS